MAQFRFVPRLTKEDIQKFLEDTMGFTKVQMLEINNVQSSCLKLKCRNLAGFAYFFLSFPGDEKYINMTDRCAAIISDHSNLYLVDESDWMQFLYSIFGKEYEQFYIDTMNKKREYMQKDFDQKLKQFDADVTLTIEKMKQNS